MKKRIVILGVIIFLAFSVVGFFTFTNLRTKQPNHFNVHVFVFTMFDKELSPWMQHEHFSYDFPVVGAFSDVHCTTQGLCVTMIGQGKTNATKSVVAILHNKQFSFNHSYFMTAGIAGTSPTTGTLGFAAWARWIVDFDSPNQKTTYHLNENLTNMAYQVTKNLTLQDSASASEDRQKYPNQKNKHPYVAVCDTVTSNNFWVGKQFSDKAQQIISQLTNRKGTYCTTEQEDTAVASVLNRFGYVDRYIDLRTASDFDQLYPGETLSQHRSKLPAIGTAVANAYTVGSTMAQYLIKNK